MREPSNTQYNQEVVTDGALMFENILATMEMKDFMTVDAQTNQPSTMQYFIFTTDGDQRFNQIQDETQYIIRCNNIDYIIIGIIKNPSMNRTIFKARFSNTV